MNYKNPELLDRLAREYVLGTLHGLARRRFAGLLGGQILARRCVLDWESRLSPLALGLAPVAPPPRVWDRLSAELGFNAGRPQPRTPALGTPTAAPWAAIAAGLAAIAVAVGLYSVTRSPEVRIDVREVLRETAREPGYVALIADKTGKPVWLLNTYPELGELRALAIAAVRIAPAQAYELWMLPDSGAAPVSLGLLPETGQGTLALDARRLEILAATSTLAVSREPAGGSPTGAPTGPVLYTATVVRARS